MGQTTGNTYRQLQNMAGNPQIQLPKPNTQTVNSETLKIPPSNLEYVWAIEYSDRLIRSIRETWHQDHPKIKGYLTTQQECMSLIYKMDAGMQSNVKCIQVKNPYYSGSVKESENQTVQSENFENAEIKIEKYDPVEYATRTQNTKEEKLNNDDPNTVDLSFLKDTYTGKVDPLNLKDLSGKSGAEMKTVRSKEIHYTTLHELERKKLIAQFGPQYINMMNYIRSEEGITESPNSTINFADSKEFMALEACFDKVGSHPLGVLPAYIGKFVLNMESNTFKFLNDATINGNLSPEEVSNMNPVKFILNETSKDMVMGKLTDIGNDFAKSSVVEFMGEKFGETGEIAGEIGPYTGEKALLGWEFSKADWYYKK